MNRSRLYAGELLSTATTSSERYVLAVATETGVGSARVTGAAKAVVDRMLRKTNAESATILWGSG